MHLRKLYTHNFQINEAENIWLWTGPRSVEGLRHMMDSLVNKLLVPSLLEQRKRVVMRRRTGEPWEDGSAPTTEPTDAELQAERVMICFDGEQKGLEALLKVFVEEIGARPELKGFILVKLAAACSSRQQPCDVSPIFMVLKRFACSGHSPTLQPSSAALEKFLRTEMLAEVPKASRDTFVNFLLHASSYIKHAFTEHNIQEGWKISGLFPYVVTTILNQCPLSATLSQVQSAAVIDAIDKLGEKMRLNGQLTDKDMQDAVGDALNLEELIKAHDAEASSSRPLEQLALNRRRAIILTHDKIVESYDKRKSRAAAPAEPDDAESKFLFALF